jgi:Novel STAND NTPase 1
MNFRQSKADSAHDGSPAARRQAGRDTARREFDMVMAWSVDRLGRSLTFLNQLVDVIDEPPEGFYLALTMRSDFLGDCARHPRFADALNRASHLLRGMSNAELAEAIIRPAALLGARIEPDLVETPNSISNTSFAFWRKGIASRTARPPTRQKGLNPPLAPSTK